MNRRDVLKLFGVGATIVPMIDGMPKTETQASLIKVPEIELITPPTPLLYGAEHIGHIISIRSKINVRISTNAGVTEMIADSFFTSVTPQILSSVTVRDSFGKTTILPGDIRWELRGYIVNDPITIRKTLDRG